MVTFLQRTFTSLVNAHVGRTQGKSTWIVKSVAPKTRNTFNAQLFAALCANVIYQHEIEIYNNCSTYYRNLSLFIG